jgi:hypothetical protein
MMISHTKLSLTLSLSPQNARTLSPLLSFSKLEAEVEFPRPLAAAKVDLFKVSQEGESRLEYHFHLARSSSS